jgi:LPS sulfotransferase NodH
MAMAGGHDTQFGADLDLPRFEGETRDYVIASTPRCGSHLLGSHLHAAGAFGVPLEYFNPTNLPHWQRRFGTAGIDDTLRALRQHRTSPNGVFGIKLHYTHLSGLGGPGRLSELFPGAHFLVARRRDTLAQALSLARALQTGAWTADMPTRSEPVYDADLIESCLRKGIRQAAAWQYVLASMPNPVLEVVYEDFVLDQAGTVHGVADFLGVPRADYAATPEDPLVRQRADEVDDWRTRFLDEHPVTGLFDAPSTPSGTRGVAGRVTRAIGRGRRR